MQNKPVAVIGSGRFGLTIASLLAINSTVYIYTRRPEVVKEINLMHNYKSVDLSTRIIASDDYEFICNRCNVIFPIVPAKGFRQMIKDLSPYLSPQHILIHGTKGLDIENSEQNIIDGNFSQRDISFMSEVILQESKVMRVGCISGPNLAKEILAGQPAATVVASEYEEVINKGSKLLSSSQFVVFGSYNLRAAEIAGAFKNIIALGSGMLDGFGYGKNMQSLIITRGLREMIQFGELLGAESKAFLGTAGIGDLVATATSESSRNYSFGYDIGSGKTTEEALQNTGEVVEGLHTLKIVYSIIKKNRLMLPITIILYKIIFDQYDINTAIEILMKGDGSQDVDFI